MRKNTASGIMLTLLLMSMLTLAFNIPAVRASGTIYIRPDGSVEGTDKIQRDGDIYTFTDNIYDSIVIERNNIVVDGACWKVQGTQIWDSKGIDLSGRSNVTIRDMIIKAFVFGVYLFESSNITVLRNKITANSGYGICVGWSLNNVILENSITNTGEGGGGILLGWSSGNTIGKNDIAANAYIGIWLSPSHGNIIYGNNITANNIGIDLGESSNNVIYHNNIVNNVQQVHDASWDHPEIWDPSMNTWDDGYPSGGNYWSDYSSRYPSVADECQGESQDALGSDGVWDYPYEIDTNNADHYPLVKPWRLVERKVGVKVGTWTKYGNFDVSWSTNDPSAKMPIGLSILNETEWWQNSVEVILDTKIRYQQLLHLKDGTEFTATCWIDVETGSGTALNFISSGLSPSDCIYESAPWFAWRINETTHSTYVGVTREINFLNITTPIQVGSPPAYPNSTGNFYWDKETGVLCELSINHLNQTGSYITSWSVSYEIVDTNLWEAPIPTELTQALIETIEAWDLPKGTKNSLTSKLEDVLHLLDIGNENGATHKLMEFMSQVEALRDKKLTNEQADYLTSESQRIIDLID